MLPVFASVNIYKTTGGTEPTSIYCQHHDYFLANNTSAWKLEAIYIT